MNEMLIMTGRLALHGRLNNIWVVRRIKCNVSARGLRRIRLAT